MTQYNQLFTTKRDRNGNRYTLIINHNARTFWRDYNPWDASEYIEIKKSDRDKLIRGAIQAGYEERK